MSVNKGVGHWAQPGLHDPVEPYFLRSTQDTRQYRTWVAGSNVGGRVWSEAQGPVGEES